MALLAFQMRAGADPALGKGKPVVVAQATPAPRKVLVRRVIVTRIVEHRPRRGSARQGGTARAPALGARRPSAPAPPLRAGSRRAGARSRRPSDHPVLMTDTPSTAWARTCGCSSPTSETAAECRAFLADFEAALSRFRADSELSRLNADPAREVAASPLLRTAISAGLLAAELTGGLVDPTLTAALEADRLRPHAAHTRAPARRGAAAPRRPRAGGGEPARAVAARDDRRAHDLAARPA